MKPAILLLLATLAPAPLPNPADRQAFQRWFTFLAESRTYAHKRIRTDILDWAYTQALAKHTRRWYASLELPLIPAIPPVTQTDCETSYGPDARILISRDLADLQPGDLLLFRDAAPMIYIGASQILPSPNRWVICEDDSGARKITLDSLSATPDNPGFLGVYRLLILHAPPEATHPPTPRQ